MTATSELEFERRVVASINSEDFDYADRLDAAIARARAELEDEERPWALVSIERDGALEGSRGKGRPGAPDYTDLLVFAGPIPAIAEAIDVECEANAIDSSLEASRQLNAADIGF
jgi:hypothetical protein